VRVQGQEGMARLSEFIGLLNELANWEDYRQISSAAGPRHPASHLEGLRDAAGVRPAGE
jgi:hypothetical protein